MPTKAKEAQRSLESLSLRELKEEEKNKKKLLSNAELLEKLSDKGERIKKGLETVQKLIAKKESEQKITSTESTTASKANSTLEIGKDTQVPLVVLTEEQLFPSLKDQKIDLFAADTRANLERKAEEEKAKKKELQDLLRYGKRGMGNVKERRTMKMISTDEAIKLEVAVHEKEKAYYEQKIQSTLKKREDKFYQQRRPTRSVLAIDQDGDEAASEGEEDDLRLFSEEDYEGSDLAEDVLLGSLSIN
eukprot:TRINITY_DN5267_c0_g1_i1.p1 TRINITY_DN5267_c0_g1~~TRINITY_DN5267_c0_g1_i1.p1  ORF type:complete len:247 (+),score=100.44 TRINITY_DN5267_c0_g1_i1:154-894(+)